MRSIAGPARKFSRAILALTIVLGMLWANPLYAPAAMGTPGALPDRPGRADRALQAVLKDLGGQRAEVIAIQRELVSRPAVNPEHGGRGEDEKARWVEAWLLKNGLPPAERIDSPDARVPAKVRPNLILHYPGTSGRTLWIMGHMDVAPAGAESQWTGSPWALRADGDTLYGRGTVDNDQCIATGLVLLKSLARQRAAPPLGLGILLISAAKTGFPKTHGTQRVLAVRPDLFKPGDLILVNDYGNAEGTLIEIAEKGFLQLKVTVRGRQAHAALPHQGVNAVHAGVEFIHEFSRLHERFPKVNPLFAPDVSTFTATTVEAGSGMPSQVPAEFVFYMDCRFVPGYTVEAVGRAVRDLADSVEKRNGVAIALERVTAIEPMPATIPTAPVVLTLRQAIVEELKKEPRLAGNGASTIAAELRARDLPVAVWQMADSLGHSVEENISVSSHLKSARIFARMLFSEDPYAGLPSPRQADNPAQGRSQ